MPYVARSSTWSATASNVEPPPYLGCITSRLEGFDYETLTKKWSRNNRRQLDRALRPVRRKGLMHKRDAELMLAEAAVGKNHDARTDERRFHRPRALWRRSRDGMDVATALNEEARELNALCVAVISTNRSSVVTDKVKEWSITALDRCLEGVEEAQTAAHICYSYPMPGPLIRSSIATLSFWKRSSIQKSISWRLKLRPRSWVPTPFKNRDVRMYRQRHRHGRDAGACCRPAACGREVHAGGTDTGGSQLWRRPAFPRHRSGKVVGDGRGRTACAGVS